jgi:hypothetical protein
MITPSVEQREILEEVKKGNNVIVDAVAGSGKTTTILFISETNPDKKIVNITYNSRLKQETREKVLEKGISNQETHSYHSLAFKYYNQCITDDNLLDIIIKDQKPKKPITFDILIIDEAQDMYPLLYRFIKKLFKDMNNDPQIVILGDTYQCIYDFKHADERYLSLADKIFPSPFSWIKKNLSISYRLTDNISNFVNKCMLGYPRIKSNKPLNIPVEYIVGDSFQSSLFYIHDTIVHLLENGYNADDIFILAPSLRSGSSPVAKLENKLVLSNILCYKPTSDDEELKDTLLRGKVVFSTYHQSKGLERKIIFLMGFNTSYYFYFKDDIRPYCTSILYVASTRAKERLYLIAEGGKKNASPQNLPFIRFSDFNPSFVKKVELDGYNVKNHTLKSFESLKNFISENERNPLRSVTELTRYLPEELVRRIMELLLLQQLSPAKYEVLIPNIKTNENGIEEMIADINGICIPTIYEHQLCKKISIQEDLKLHFINGLISQADDAAVIKKWVESVLNEPKDNSDYLKIANVYQAYSSGFIFKLYQLPDYSWLLPSSSKKMVDYLHERVQGTENTEFEHTLNTTEYDWNGKRIDIQGRADIVTSNDLWEIKCVSALKSEHFIQLALYAWIWNNYYKPTQGTRSFKILNIKTGEEYQIKGIHNLDYIISMLMDHHFKSINKVSDDEFIQGCDRAPKKKIECLIMDD